MAGVASLSKESDMRTLLKSSLFAMTALALAGTAVAQGDNPDNGGRKVAASLTGDGVVSGDTDGVGIFEARVNPGTERICYSIEASSIAAATAATIDGADNHPVLTLDTPDGDDDDSEDCQDIDRGLAQALIQHPEDYAVTVQSPSGAIRGKLRKGS